jgi:hypothetical protein
MKNVYCPSLTYFCCSSNASPNRGASRTAAPPMKPTLATRPTRGKAKLRCGRDRLREVGGYRNAKPQTKRAQELKVAHQK